jgi:hypothetical protein
MATDQQKLNAWTKARAVNGYNPTHVRMDDYGTMIVWGEYGQTTQYGWEIDHELPQNGYSVLARLLANQRALHWRNNRAKSDKIDPNTLRKLQR